ncbi:MAG TPA: tripartite tricarboxylate transporter substrate binding protein [Usitatibacter sp.]|nr:tripartite tricarboxylate transporter substrate binding protein [Usitatibacter sp.]
MTTRLTRTIKACAALLLCLASNAFAQGDYPSRPIRIIVPYAAGGGADILSRLLAKRLGDRLKQAVIVENQGGGSNTIGMSAVAHAAKDGYTLGLATPVFVMTPSLMKTHPYDIFKDFTPVAMIGFTPLVLVVHPSVPAKNLQEFVALGKSKPGTLNFASLGQATTQGLAGTLFNMMTGIDAVQIPYKGSAPGTTDLLAGNVQYMFNALPSELAHIQSGRLRALGVSSLKRSPSLPDVPSINDTVKGYDVTTWYSLVAPAGTPPEIVDKLSREIGAIIESPAIKDKLREQGVEADAMTPAQLGTHLHKEHDRWAKVIHDAKIQPE